ncbi:MAG: glutamine synthetase III [Candidatus Margulisbacteria bacterium]|nr:glutamine synthetase III [Candidatus Margulisiibacteriota bacterium]
MVKTASQIFGELTFNRQVMKSKLSKEVYAKLSATLDSGASLDETIASDVAHAMKEWAIENGATHFTHWFQPQRGGTAEKHDAFLSYGKDGEMIERFSAKQLIQSEPDASSFPSGGIRSTFEARGYTAWDPTSPAFLLEAGDTKTLVIPTVYLSWTGEVLDLKTPLLRSMKALTESVNKLHKALGNKPVKKVRVYGGPEQEYFLVSKELFDSRPDLRITGRTLFGAPPAKGQQLEDHYFGAIKDKVMMFMEDFDTELYRHGIPSKTRHNEVSPNQFEIAPLYEEVNLAIDHNLQLMEIIKRVAERHNLVAILYEKPFAGVNGSGKHFNWSLGDDETNYLEPSDSPIKNINFLLTLGAILIGVNKFGGLLRAAVADAGNDHRLGANEAPPAIMSVYLGEYLAGLMDEIEGVGSSVTEKSLAHINLGVKNLPKVAKDTSDRNRTSPVAFTGNKFEFRAVGSSQNCAEAGTTLNLLVAYGYDEIARRLTAKKGKTVEENAVLVMKDVLKETKPVRFEGNNYSAEWHKEAEKRGLPNAKNTPDALDLMLDKECLALYEKYGVLAKRELHSKVEIKQDAYVKVKDVEFKCALNIAQTMILPAVVEQICALGEAVKAAGKTGALNADLKAANALYGEIRGAIRGMEKAITTCEKEDDLGKKAKLYARIGAGALAQLRASVDKAETIVADGYWPMAKYQELLTVL